MSLRHMQGKHGEMASNCVFRRKLDSDSSASWTRGNTGSEDGGHDLFKRIDQFDPATLKVLDVSGGYGKSMGVGDAGNLPVRQDHGAPCFLAMPHDFGIGVAGWC